MKTRGKTLAQEAIFQCRIYFIFSAVAFHCLYLNVAFSQEIGSYRTIASGNFGNIGIWQVYDGAIWSPATLKPSQINDIYIDRTHLLTLTGNEEVKSLFINADAGAAQKLNLNGNNLDIYGTLQAFDGAAPGIPAGTNASLDWIGNSLSSTITFKGGSRVIIPDGTWSAQSTNSRYAVIFDPGSGIELITQRAFKALQFTIRSGIVNQKINTTSIPNACSTFSFNTNNSFGSNEYGDFIIETGAKLISECSSDILFRSGTASTPRSAALFDLQAGGELILEGSSPQIEAANIQLDGKVTYRKNSGTQNFLSKSYASSTLPQNFHDLEIQGSQNVNLPATLSLTGNISQIGSGAFNLSNTELHIIGSTDQTVSGFAMNVNDLIVNKPAGTAFFEQNLIVRNKLSMDAGEINFQGNNLILNTLGSGGLEYNGGQWRNLGLFTYQNTPTSLTALNATFPFYDLYQGGIRKVQMLGTSAGGNLTIQFTEYKGADFNPSFNDLDSTPILYRLFSYFQFSGLASTSNPLELRISANNLIVDNPDDVRLVCTGYAAPGVHVPGTDTSELWAIRELTFDDLPGKNFTVGSFRTLTILPVTWLSLSAKLKDTARQITWSVAQEKDNEKFEIYSSTDPLMGWSKIGEVSSDGNSDVPVSYTFIDESLPRFIDSYYRIKQIDFSGKWSWSHVVRHENDFSKSTDRLSIFPNPHTNGKIRVSVPESFHSEKTQVLIYSTQGVLISSFSFNDIEFSERLEIMQPGVYLITFSNSDISVQMRWIKH
ncbi:T9SS type A sorting domain-containing protein [Algoriphagus antarcticus]|uniref:Putative secreted protein (Por secretion system target) n=1 Tax=Algoriphagus antarcticus TaxID=238540 RepID=A0A3E0DV74_9BACT|nr:T9SS type A sorting domain-containing protein [Algoriphagus antarcticus]REG88508.1 putative secreted protein (Por secretion system target) [Algoriphagus antarcticus]